MNKKFNGKVFYYLGDEYTGLDAQRHQWIKDEVGEGQFIIHSDGFLIDEYYVEFKNTQDEALYVFTWEIPENSS